MKSLTIVRSLGVLSVASLVSLAACGGGAATDSSASNSSSSGGQSSTAAAASTGANTTATSTAAPTGNLVANGDAHVGDRTNQRPMSLAM
jgi:hypothetical protein